MYFNKLDKGNLLYLLKVNPNYIDSQLLVTTLTYDSAGYNVHYNMTYPIKIVPQDTLRSLTCEPRLKYLNAKEDYHPTIYANFGKYISNISLNNSDVSVSIADPNVMSFNGNLLVAKDTGSTYVVISYRGLKDTTYYVITPPIEVVPEACVPPTVDFSFTTNGKTITLTNKSTNATSYKWKLSNGVVFTTTSPSYTFIDTGDYLICLTSYNACDSTKICQTVKLTGTAILDSFTISASVNPVGSGTISGAARFPSNQTCSLVASANTNFEFLNWTESSTEISAIPNYSFTVDKNRNLVANFKSKGSGISNSYAHNIFIYPNPAYSILNIDLPTNDFTQMRIENILGQVLLKWNLIKMKNQLDISSIPKGIYIIELSNTKGDKSVQKLTIE